MDKPQLYIIAGPNGAGKTTAAKVILPEILEVTNFVNADEIARGLSPFDVEKVAIQAAKIMLNRVYELIDDGESFGLETTLSSKGIKRIIAKAKNCGYEANLLFLWLEDAELAQRRVAKRVVEGGHNIPKDVIKRRYYRGISSFFNVYMNEVDSWIFADNSEFQQEILAKYSKNEQVTLNLSKFEMIKRSINEK